MGIAAPRSEQHVEVAVVGVVVVVDVAAKPHVAKEELVEQRADAAAGRWRPWCGASPGRAADPHRRAPAARRARGIRPAQSMPPPPAAAGGCHRSPAPRSSPAAWWPTSRKKKAWQQAREPGPARALFANKLAQVHARDQQGDEVHHHRNQDRQRKQAYTLQGVSVKVEPIDPRRRPHQEHRQQGAGRHHLQGKPRPAGRRRVGAAAPSGRAATTAR